MYNWRNVLSWEIQREEESKDTRTLFYDLVSRKAGEWSDVNTVVFNDLDEEQKAALLSTAVIKIELRDTFAYFRKPEGTYEFILYNTLDDAYYYINTEGYNYARYAFKIISFPN